MIRSMFSSIAERLLQVALDTSHGIGERQNERQVQHADRREILQRAEVHGALLHGDEGQLRQADGLQIGRVLQHRDRSEEHTYELQSLMRNSYAVFCLKKKKNINNSNTATLINKTQTE